MSEQRHYHRISFGFGNYLLVAGGLWLAWIFIVLLFTYPLLMLAAGAIAGVTFFGLAVVIGAYGGPKRR
jgi:hypothetical protein